MRYKNKIELLDTYGILYIGTAEFLFDLEDLPLIQSRRWYRDKDGYLVSSYIFAGKRCFVRFHRIVLKAQPTQYVDHINKNRADNRKKNLRLCSHVENDRNRGVYSSNTSGVTGVHYERKRKKWVASITYDGKRVFIGRFSNKADAITARLKREKELFGDFAPQISGG